MASYFDRQGNIYQIDDQKALKKKDRIDVWSETGEEFSIPAEIADEHRLTEDERAKVFTELSARISALLRVAGASTSGCQVIDPANLAAVLGTPALAAQAQQAMPQQQLAGAFSRLGTLPGGGCPIIDPASLGAILGTRVLPQQNQLLSNLLRATLGGCPAIDPVGPGAILGTLGQLANLQQGGLERMATGGCPNIDPINLGTIAGLVSQLASRRPANVFEQMFGGGCPNIDPVQLGTLLGTLGALRGGRF